MIKWAFDQYVGVALSFMSRYPVGTNVYKRDWDTLVLLDTCRVDALKEVADDYDFLPSSDDIGSITSIASGSYTWMANTFVEEYARDVSNTVYISANGYSEQILENGWRPEEDRGLSNCNWRTLTADDLRALDQPWRHGKDLLGHPDPEYVTERAIGYHREYEPDRMIVHYSQPHEPYISQAIKEERDELHDHEDDPWSFLKDGGDFDAVWDCYIDDLRMVLEHVETLLNNHDAEKVVISADHGEAFGEFGVYRHPVAVLHPKTRKVPWAVTSAEDRHEKEGSIESQRQVAEVEDALEDLGYL
ncbi:hypothetical protein [Halorubrum sp. CSM-61]|uniref:hypothetical protein n=1 Tax=Halorubrum sp. CSM-61 TaxID=2485838 RepID=UPI000F4CB433|nr:hypothetical protein [Halorubrum sp. CSM-61]